MVDYTLTPNKSLVKPNRGTYVDTWDTPINSDWDYVDRALGGTYTVGVQAVPATPVVLTNDQARYQQIKTANQTDIITITIPLIEGSSTIAVGGMWIIDNVSNTFDVNLTTLAPGTNIIVVKAGKRQTVFSNGSGIFFCDDSRITPGTGLTLTGNSLALTSPVTSANGGTGFSNGYTSGQLLIGKSDGTLGRATITPGSNITISNGDGTITISSTASGGGGGISSITWAGTTGLTFTNSGSTSLTVTVGGTLNVGNGGTGQTTFTAGFLKANGTTAFTTVASIDLANDVGKSTLAVANGGTGVTKSTGTGSVVLSDGPTFTSTTKADSITASGTIRADELRITNATSVIYLCNTTTTYIASTTSLFGVAVGGSSAFSASATAFVVPGSMTAANYITSSDARIKKNIAPYNKSLADLTALSPVTFQYNGQYGTVDNGVTYVGLIAQDVQASSMNSMVTTRTYIDPKTGQKTDVLGISQNDIIFALINAVKDLDQRVKALEAKVGP